MAKYGSFTVEDLSSVVEPGELFSGATIHLDLGCSKPRADQVLRDLWNEGLIERPKLTVAKYIATEAFLKRNAKSGSLNSNSGLDIEAVGSSNVGLSKLEKMLYCGKLC